MEEACGVFAVYAPGQPVATSPTFGPLRPASTAARKSGLASPCSKTRQDKRLPQGHGPGQPRLFDQDVLERMPGDLAIATTR